jgi:hypothetical protein
MSDELDEAYNFLYSFLLFVFIFYPVCLSTVFLASNMCVGICVFLECHGQ